MRPDRVKSPRWPPTRPARRPALDAQCGDIELIDELMCAYQKSSTNLLAESREIMNEKKGSQKKTESNVNVVR